MPQAARITDAVAGTTAGEHTGHVPTHSPEPFSGEISGACSGTVRINGLSAATVGSITTERDGCCGSSQGAVGAGSGTVRINGKPAARMGDTLAAHSGSGTVTGGSPDVKIGGYVRQAGNGCFVLCQEAEAAGIAHNGTVYHLLGREALEGAESVILEKTDAGDLVKRIQDTAKDVDAMNVDQELRLTLLEMGISSTDAQAF